MSHWRNESNHDNGGVPPRWLKCPRKAELFISEKFIVFKTPLGPKYNEFVPIQYRFPPKMILDHMSTKQVRLGLWIDLTNTDRYYSREDIESCGITYVKVNCLGHSETPTSEQVDTFIKVCRNFMGRNSKDYIGVHCTHGFNRTGFLICSFLVQEFDFSIQAALSLFARCRPPGIYKQGYINKLWELYSDGDDNGPPPPAPPLPDWCYDDEGVEDDDGTSSSSFSSSISTNNKRKIDEVSSGSRNGSGGGRKRRGEIMKENPCFMDGVKGVDPVSDRGEVGRIQRKVQLMCEWERTGFPGSQPVSMDVRNIRKLSEKQYMVSWKADGTRYLLLIENRENVFFIDRDNCVFKVNDMSFPCKKDSFDHLHETLVDGEMVIDNVNGTQIPRYLIYDIIRFRGNETGKCDFRVRLNCIRDEIVNPRYKAIETGHIDRAAEPFGVRFKTFWFVEDTERILEGKFTQELLHEPDGVIFQPVKDPYQCGRCDEVLKWKPPELNTVDFRLKVVTQTGEGLLPTKIGELYVGQLQQPFSIMKPIPKKVQELNGRIIECKYDGKTWVFLRERTDKSFPNAYETAKAVVFSIQYPVTKDYLLEFIALHRFRKQSMI